MDDGTNVDESETTRRRWPGPGERPDGTADGRAHGAGQGPSPTTIEGSWPETGQGPPPSPPPALPGPHDPRWRPGLVPWGWRETVLGILIAAAPIVLLTLFALLVESSSGSQRASEGGAFFGVVVTLIIDSWYLFAAWLFSLRRRRLGPAGWGYRTPRGVILWAVPLALAAVFAVNVAYSQFVTTRQQTVVSDFPHTATGLVLFLLLGCVIAPLFEETLFRGFIFQGFASSLGPVWGALISAALFSLSHQQLDIFVPLFALGLGLAWVFYVARSLWANIALHSLFNLISIIAWAASG